MSAQLSDIIKSLLALATGDDVLEIVPEIAAFLNRAGFEYWWTAKDVYLAFERAGIHLSKDSFYSPLPNTVEAAAHLAGGRPLRAALHLLNGDAFYREWAKIRRFKEELSDIPQVGEDGFHWSNNFFPNLDAILYYCLIRQYRPQLVFEIGSGFSTHIAARALRANGSGRLVVVEPYPTAKLSELFGDLAKFYQQKIQDVPLESFARLQAKDFLFVDSSHVCKTGSDVNHILFEVLPIIAPGVFLHFHDIFLPYDYPVEWVVERSWAWNEQYILLALLMGNDALEPIVGSHLLQRKLGHILERDLAQLNAGPLSGGSLWIKTRSEPSEDGRNGKCR